MTSKVGVAVAAIVMTSSFGATSAVAQDYNYVPGWANTHNHRYQQDHDGEWDAKIELFNALSVQGPAARCTLQNLSDADGNVIVNQYRRNARRTNETLAFQKAQEQVETHQRRLTAEGKC